jgi:serine/threonine-protein kinase
VGSAALSKRTCPRCKQAFDPDAAFCSNDGTPLEPTGEPPPDSDRYIGTVIQGDIEIRSVAGSGAMGRVYRGWQRSVERDVAVKILHRELSGNLPLVQRFHREAKIASKLQHPHVVEVYLAGQLPDGALYIAMEYLDGMSLAAALQASGGVMPLERALPIVLQICDAVGEGHSRGIVHRDLKPENVMLVRRAETSDWVKVLDFGIAKVSLGEQSMETAAGLIFGTARYVSPEGAQGATVGPPGDVYSIATILYQLLAGRTPFDAEQPVGLLIKHIHDQPPPLRSWPATANVPEPIARVVMDNLVKDPSRRAPSARALGNALASAAKEANVSISDVGVVARMRMPDIASRRGGVDPTLDDVPAPTTAVLPPSVPPVTPVLPATTPITPANMPVEKRAPSPADALAETRAEETVPREISQPPGPMPSRTTAASPNSQRTGRTRSTVIVLLAFLLGVALTLLAMQHLSRRKDGERAELLQRARRALAAGHYTEPPGDNVRELVATGLARWPDDSELLTVQSDAAHEVVTRALAARSGGDVAGARDLAKTAHDLDPTDGTARLLLAQYEDELLNALDGGIGELAGPRVTLDVPIGRARPGVRAELLAHVMTGTKPREITGASFLVRGPGLQADGLLVPALGLGPFRGSFVPPREGSFTVEFEANIDGAIVRAVRVLDVSP